MPPPILVVDDRAAVADGYAAQLDSAYRVHTAYGGRAALGAAEEHDPAVVLLDRRMPDLDGDEVLARLRERDRPPQVAMLTGVEPDADLLSLPADDYLVKPSDSGALRETVDTLYRRSAYDRQLQRCFRIASRLATLEAEVPAVDLRTDDRYWRLRDRLRRLRRDQGEELADEQYAVAVGSRP
jgi:DNA-binding response OmpR family regulator